MHSYETEPAADVIDLIDLLPAKKCVELKLGYLHSKQWIKLR